MTVQTTFNKQEYTGNGVTTTFDFSFPFFVKDDIVVTQIDTFGVEIQLVIGTNYSIPGVPFQWWNDGSSIILSSPLKDQYKLIVERIVSPTQETSLRNLGRYDASAIEKEFDKLTMLCQQITGNYGEFLSKNKAGEKWLTEGLPFDSLNLGSDLDARNFRVLNLPAPIDLKEPMRKGDAISQGAGPSFQYVDDHDTLHLNSLELQSMSPHIGRNFILKDRDNYLFTTELTGYGDGFSSISTANGLFVNIIPFNNCVTHKSLGIVADNATVNKLVDVCKYLNDKHVNLIVENTASTQILFDDYFHLKDTKIISSTGSYFYWKGGDNDRKPTMIFGNTLDEAYPNYFESSKAGWRPGEIVEFNETGQSYKTYGDVMFVSDGKVYFKWFPNGNHPYPQNGTIASKTTNLGETYNPSTISLPNFGAPSNAGFDNLYLSTDLIGDPATAHVMAAGVMVNGVRQGRSFGGIGSLTCQGFDVPGFFVFNWFLDITGTLEAQKCADGFLFTSENNSMNINRAICSCGSVYDSVKRWKIRIPYSYATTIENLVIEGDYGISYANFDASHGVKVGAVNTENNTVHSTILLQGSPVLDYLDDAFDNEGSRLFMNAFDLGPARYSQALGPTVGRYIDGCTIRTSTFDYPVAGTSIPMAWKSLLDTTNCFFVNSFEIEPVFSSHADASALFYSEGDLDPRKIKYVDANYTETEISATYYKPSSDTELLYRKPIGPETKRYYIDTVGVSNRKGGSPTFMIYLLNNTGAGLSQGVTLDDTYQYFNYVSSYTVRTSTNFIDLKINGLSNSQSDNYAFYAKIYELKL